MKEFGLEAAEGEKKKKKKKAKKAADETPATETVTKPVEEAPQAPVENFEVDKYLFV